MSERVAGSLVISETPSGTWHYHLRVIGPEGFKPGGGAPPALCGRALGWDTFALIESWNKKSGGVSVVYCAACTAAAKSLGFDVPEKGEGDATATRRR
ncbi:hypothetical protein Rctr197k_114 [Virus Rctr197k]|nr:hypothetical protein Rctr197k_114 [Virus Rctr197k]